MNPRLTAIGIAMTGLALAGCATLTPQEQDQLRAQVGGLQSQVAALHSRVEELRTRQQALEERAWERAGRPASSGRVPAVAAVSSHRVLTAKEIQLALQRAGHYQGPMDGKIGAQTRVAIKLFQAAHSLTADGVAGTKTMAALESYLTPPPVSPPEAVP